MTSSRESRCLDGKNAAAAPTLPARIGARVQSWFRRGERAMAPDIMVPHKGSCPPAREVSPDEPLVALMGLMAARLPGSGPSPFGSVGAPHTSPVRHVAAEFSSCYCSGPFVTMVFKDRRTVGVYVEDGSHVSLGLFGPDEKAVDGPYGLSAEISRFCAGKTITHIVAYPLDVAGCHALIITPETGPGLLVGSDKPFVLY